MLWAQALFLCPYTFPQALARGAPGRTVPTGKGAPKSTGSGPRCSQPHVRLSSKGLSGQDDTQPRGPPGDPPLVPTCGGAEGKRMLGPEVLITISQPRKEGGDGGSEKTITGPTDLGQRDLPRRHRLSPCQASSLQPGRGRGVKQRLLEAPCLGWGQVAPQLKARFLLLSALQGNPTPAPHTRLCAGHPVSHPHPALLWPRHPPALGALRTEDASARLRGRDRQMPGPGGCGGHSEDSRGPPCGKGLGAASGGVRAASSGSAADEGWDSSPGPESGSLGPHELFLSGKYH